MARFPSSRTRYYVRNGGWGFTTIGVVSLLLPFLPRDDGTRSGHSPGLIAMAVVFLILGAVLLIATRAQDHGR